MRLLIVSNRLPITISSGDREVRFRPSVGGLATGILGYLDSFSKGSSLFSDYFWIGWPGATVNPQDQNLWKQEAYSQSHAHPVFFSEQDMDNFYHGFCNKTIWALFHYFTAHAVYDENYWVQYKEVNEIFCRAVEEIAKPGDAIWIHDYHLMLLPRLLRERIPEAAIGFFLHIPFPSFEVFRMLPSRWRNEILEGILGADLIGFHTQDYVQYFLRCVLRLLGYEHNMGQILLSDRTVKVDTFPMGIDYQKFHHSAESAEVKQEKAELRSTLGDCRPILSIDRLDYSKGIAQRLRGYEMFLEGNPQWHGKTTLLLVVVPSRVEVESYQLMKKEIDELVGRINGRFARIDWTPILYQYKSLPLIPLVALYSVSDVILVTPLRDGMNLIAKEYIASRVDETGVLVLSEMAGASKELGESILVNPNIPSEVAQAIQSALEMPEDEQKRRIRIMQGRLERYDVLRWATDFIESLQLMKDQQKKFRAKLLTVDSSRELIQAFANSRRRLIFLDYDGTLVPFSLGRKEAKPSASLLSLLRHLTEVSATDVVIVSGRTKNTLENWFGKLEVGLIAEHGVYLKHIGQDWKMLKHLNQDWKSQVLPIFYLYADRLPGSFVEEKDFSIAYHYREADPDQASIRIKELTDNLVHLTANIDVHVLQGSKVVEITNAGVDKGTAARQFVSRGLFDFVLAIGDDWTDEDLFRMLPEAAYSIKVGIAASHAKYNLRNYAEVQELLESLILQHEFAGE